MMTRISAAVILAVFVLSSAAIAGSLKLAWDASTPADLVAGYKLYYGTESGKYGAPIDVGNSLTGEIPNLDEATRYYVVATAYDEWGRESDYSVEISARPAKPGTVKNVKVVAEKVNISVQTLGK